MIRRLASTDGVLRLLVVGAVLAIWEIISDTRIVNPFFISSPVAVAGQIVAWAREGILLHALGVTLLEMLGGYAAAVLLGLVTGMSLAFLPRVSEVINPYMTTLNALPRLMLAPILITWFGLGLESKVIYVVVVVFFIVYFGVLNGMYQVMAGHVENARVMGATGLALLIHVYAPASVGWIASSMRTAIGFAFAAAIVAEYIGSTEGLGYLVIYGQNLLLPTYVFAGLVVVVALAVAIDLGVRVAQRALTPWSPT